MSLFLVVGTMFAQTFPVASTKEAPKYYTIGSYNRGGVLTDVDGVPNHIAVNENSYWYFTKADDNGGLHFCNLNGKYLTSEGSISETPAVWYVLSNGVNEYGVSISKTNPISLESCLDAKNTGTGVGTWAPNANDWEGTTWVFVEVDYVKNIEALLEANKDNHAELPALGQYSTAGYEALAAAKETVKDPIAAAAAITAFEMTKNLYLFTIDGGYADYTLGKSIYENESGELYLETTDKTNRSMLWAFDMTATEVGVTDKVVVRNAATGNLFWGASFMKVTETIEEGDVPGSADDGIFLLYKEGTGNPVHAQKNWWDTPATVQVVTYHSLGANTASAWKFTFVGISNPAAYDFSEVADIFKEKAVAFAGLQENAALSALGAVQEKWAETMGVVEPLFGAVEEGALVLKADVEAAIKQMDAITAVVDFYSGEAFTAALAKAGAAMDELDEESDEFVALLAATQVSTVTTVAQLEAKITEIDEIIAALEPEADPNDYTSYITEWTTDMSYSDDKLYRSSVETFDFYQTITLPAGQYKMTAQAAYRYAGSSDLPTSEEFEYNKIQAGEEETHLAKLYAQTATYKYEADVQNRWEGASDVNYVPEGEAVNTVNGKFVPNSTIAVVAWFKAGKYLNELVFNVQEECEVRIGIAKPEADEVGQYTNIGAWTLTRLGDAEADPQPEEPEYTEEDYDLDAPAYTDVTAQYVKNAAMSANIDGWTSAGGGTAYEAAVYEFYAGWGALENTSGSLTQSVTLPAGTYRLTGKAFYRAGAAYDTKPGVSLGYLVAGNNKVLVKTLGSIEGLGAYADNRPQASTAFYTDGLYDNVLDFVLEEETTLNIGYECTHEDIKSWFIVGAVKLESVQAVPGALVPLFEAQAQEFCQYNSEAMSSLPAVSKNWEDLCGRVMEIYEAISNEEKVLDKVVRGVMDEMTAMTAELAAIEKAYANFKAAKSAIYAIQDNSTPNNDDVKAAFDAAVEKACTVSTVTTPAELEAKVAEMEAARQVYVMNAVPGEDFSFDMTFKVVNPNMDTNTDGWEGGWAHQGSTKQNGDVVMSKFQEKWVESTGGLGTTSAYQTIKNLPSGVYSVTATVNATRQNAADQKAAATGVSLFANEEAVAVATYDGKPEIFTVEDVIVINDLTLGIKCENAEANWVGFDNVEVLFVSELPEDVALPLKKELFTTMATEFIPAVEAFPLYMIAQNELFSAYEAVGNMNADEATLDELEEAIAAMVAANAIMDEANAIYAEYSVFVNYFKEASEYSEPLTAEAAELLQYNMSGTGAMLATSVDALANQLEYIKEDYIAYITNAKTYDGYMFDVTCLVANAEVTSGEGWSGNNDCLNHKTAYEGAPDKTAFDAGWWTTNINIHQELPELPAGDYKLSAIARSNSTESYIYAKSGETEVKATLPQNGDQGGELGNGWANVSTETINVAAGESLTIGVYINNPGTQFAAADNFKLYYGGSTAEPEPEIEVTLNKWVYEFAGVGETFQLEATITPEDVEGLEIVWSSSDDLVATVDQNGLVTSVGMGEADIIVTVNGVEYSCWVEVLSNDPTGIENIDAEVETVIYDLSGRRVQKMEKGIYIVNGKKVIVK